MSFARRSLLAIVTMAVIASAGCSAQSATPSPTPSPAPTPIPTLASYSTVVGTYPAGVAMCGEIASWFKGALGFNVTCDDIFHFAGSGAKPNTVVVSIGTTKLEFSPDVVRDYGVKVEVDAATPVGSTTYPAGAMLTVDANRNWIQVSGW